MEIYTLKHSPLRTGENPLCFNCLNLNTNSRCIYSLYIHMYMLCISVSSHHPQAVLLRLGSSSCHCLCHQIDFFHSRCFCFSHAFPPVKSPKLPLHAVCDLTRAKLKFSFFKKPRFYERALSVLFKQIGFCETSSVTRCRNGLQTEFSAFFNRAQRLRASIGVNNR